MTPNQSPKMQEVSQQCRQAMEAFRRALAQREQVLVEQYRSQVALRREGLEKERQTIARQLQGVSPFRFSRRRELRQEQERLEKCIAEYSSSAPIQQARMELQRKMDKAMQRYQLQLDGYLTRRFPYDSLRLQAQAEFDGWYKGSHSQLKDLIYAAVAQAPGSTLEQIQTAHPRLRERSRRRMEFLLEELVKKGQLTQALSGADAVYTLGSERKPKQPNFPQVDFAYEDPEIAAQPIPAFPPAEEIL